VLEQSISTSAEETPKIGLRVRPIMRQGTPSGVQDTWRRYDSLEAARAAVKPMYHDDRVLRVFVVTDEMPPRFVEWVER
jgi:hypothetical protein